MPCPGRLDVPNRFQTSTSHGHFDFGQGPDARPAFIGPTRVLASLVARDVRRFTTPLPSAAAHGRRTALNELTPVTHARCVTSRVEDHRLSVGWRWSILKTQQTFRLCSTGGSVCAGLGTPRETDSLYEQLADRALRAPTRVSVCAVSARAMSHPASSLLSSTDRPSYWTFKDLEITQGP